MPFDYFLLVEILLTKLLLTKRLLIEFLLTKLLLASVSLVFKVASRVAILKPPPKVIRSPQTFIDLILH